MKEMREKDERTGRRCQNCHKPLTANSHDLLHCSEWCKKKFRERSRSKKDRDEYDD